MHLNAFNYKLPKNLIAQEPIRPRDHSRLLVLKRKTGGMKHRHFYDIAEYLKPGDVLVLNNTKVMRARLIGSKAETGGKVEVFLLKKTLTPRLIGRGIKGEVWQCLIGGKGRKENLRVNFKGGLKAEIIQNNSDGTWLVSFNKSGRELMKIVEKIGRVPLPPYIKRIKNYELGIKNDRNSYQTVYANNAKLGSVAAPTAGLHFTKALINKLKKKGVQFEYVTLQVGLGTFAPVKADDIAKHKMHAEWIEADKNTLRRIAAAKLAGRRIVAVGTTSARTLESVFSKMPSHKLKTSCEKNKRLRVMSCEMRDYSGWTDIFIYPPYKFKIVDALITNFHLPKSTLLMLISAFAGRDMVFKAYGEAIKKKYRFYSYGDAMLIV